MPWKLILILIIFGLFIAFTGFNLENASVISFGFVVLDRVPIFLSLSVAFLAGAFFTIPFTIFRAKPKKLGGTEDSGSLLGKAQKKIGRKSKEGSAELSEQGVQYHGDEQNYTP